MVNVSLPTLHIYTVDFYLLKQIFRYLKRWIGECLTQESFLELCVLSTK